MIAMLLPFVFVCTILAGSVDAFCCYYVVLVIVMILIGSGLLLS